MTDLFEDYFDDGEALTKVDSGTGKQLSDLVRSLRKHREADRGCGKLI